MVFLLLTSNFVILNGFYVTGVVTDRTRNFDLSYTPHGAILITGNQDFIDQGWPGSGNETHPYLIEGLNITSTHVCIDIRYVDVHFVIRDCFLRPTELNYTINLFHADNGTIDNCKIDSPYRGIEVEYCDNLTIVDSNFTITDLAVASIEYSNYVNLTGCNFFESEATTYPMRVGLGNCEDSIVTECYFDSAVLQIGWSPNLTITDNIFVNGGIVVNTHILYDPPWDYEIAGNTANGKPILYLEDVMDTTVNAADYAQVILLQCDNVVVENGVMANVPYGVQILYSTFCSVESLSSSGNTQAVIVIESNSTTISECTIEVEYGFGIAVYYSYDCVVQDNTLSGYHQGGQKLIYLASCYDSAVQRNDLSGLFQGIEVSGYDCTVVDNTMTDCNTGIRLSGARLTIEGNTILESTDDHVQPPFSHGILAAPLWNSTITDNDFLKGDDWGILYLGNGTQFIGNRFSDNFGIGLEIYAGSTNNSVYGNLFDRNYGGNALDNGFSNQWDDGISSGNRWSDYDQVVGGPYNIPGTASSQDRYPIADLDSPEVSHPNDVVYPISVTVVNVTWQVSDAFPYQYWLYHNNEILHQGIWSSGSLTFAINVTMGPIHNATLVLTDLFGNTVSDTVMLTLGDTAGPGPGGLIEFDPLILAVGAGAIGILVIALVIVKKRRT